jgi:hypothetical protein
MPAPAVRAARPSWRPYLVLALPFLIAIGLARGLTVSIPTFHDGDELTFHYPVILKFAREFPRLDLSDYNSATPLFHILFMLAGKVMGFELYKLRLLNAVISWLAVVLLFRLLQSAGRMSSDRALTFALVFGLSPYFFGVSFLLLTDNLTWLLCFAAMLSLREFERGGRLRDFVVSCLCTGACLLTRQIFLWLAVMVGLALLRSPLRAGAKIAGGLTLAACLAPLLGLFAIWRGLVPPSFRFHETTGWLTTRPVVSFMMALIGLYALLMRPELYLERLHAARVGARQGLGLVAVLVAALLLLVLQPIRSGPGEDGYVWRLSLHVPTLLSTGILFWVLAPLGWVAIYDATRSGTGGFFLMSYLATFMLVSLSNHILFQKYYDPFALLAVFLLIGDRAASGLDRVGWTATGAGFVLYAATKWIRP